VGDRYVLELLQKNNWQLGGENSGHILTLDITSSGDAIIAALQVLQALQYAGKSLAELALPLYPQVLINVAYQAKANQAKLDLNLPAIQQAVKQAETQLQATGRVLLRASGTEPKIRVMVEGQDGKLVQKLADDIAKVVKKQSE
jgi:phosphoglucosamine mutase